MTCPFPLNSKDKKDLEVYLKQFCFKSIQTIVCSRHGSPITSDSSSHSPSWFNVTMSDNPTVAEDCKAKVSVADLIQGRTISLTIQLHTPEEEVMTLEVWTFCLEKRYVQVKVTFTVYNALCLLLRSVIVASRATPTYRLTRKQTTGGFFYVSYEISTDEVRVQELGDSVRSERIGVVGTPSGTMTTSVYYRTSLEIPSSTPSPTGGKSPLRTPVGEGPFLESPESDALPFCPFADTTLPQLSDVAATNLIDDRVTPFASLLESAFPFTQTTSATASHVFSSPDLKTPLPGAPLPGPASLPSPGSPRINRLQKVDVMTSDSFVLIAPFASNSPEDVGAFFRDCASIPKLKLFSEPESQSSIVNPSAVEQDVKEIEDFLNKLSIDDLSS